MNAKKEGLKNPSFLLPIKIKYLGASPQTLQSSVWSELCFAKRSLTAASIFRTLLRKAAYGSRIFLCGSLVKAFCYAKRSIVKILLRKTAYSVSGLRCF